MIPFLKHSLQLALGGLLLITTGVFTSCTDDDDPGDTWTIYAKWREANEDWLIQQAALTDASGKNVYTRIVPTYAPSTYLLKRQIGEVHEENLQPLYSSAVTVNYAVYLYDGTLIDSSANFTSTLNSTSLIDGWSMAILTMHAQDSAEFLMPANIGYGETGATGVYPYSALRFNIKVVDIPNYQTRPE